MRRANTRTRWAAGILLPLPIVTLGRATIHRARMEWRALWKHADAALVHAVDQGLEQITVWTFVCALVIGLLHVSVFGQYAPVERALSASASPIVRSPTWQVVAIFGAIMAIYLPALGAAVHGFLSQGDFRNLAHRSQRMCEHLSPLAAEVAHAPLRFEDLGIAAEKAAAVMRDEVVYWRVFVRLKPPALV